ncbi:MAG: D-alanine--D-alanine ligase [Planctomycetota bacterium]|nr:MAG: D-alanine--D-alanine ligase [Planctomycetota bacterium]
MFFDLGPAAIGEKTRFMVGQTYRVLVLYGGDSAERAVSLESGSAVAAALAEAGHDVRLLDPAHEDLWEYDFAEFDVVFPMLHGAFGEDGGVQEILRRRGMPFVGSDAKASALAFHKSRAKDVWRRVGLPTPRSVLLDPEATPRDVAAKVRGLRPPLVVKPDAQGSSIGVAVGVRPETMTPAIERAREAWPWVLIEEFVSGDEWTVALFECEPFPAIRIRPGSRFYDYHAKYVSDRTVFDVAPTDVPREIQQHLQRLAVDAAESLGVRGISRVDLRVVRPGSPWLLEVVTIPGMAAHSLVPMAARAAGWSLAELCDRAVREALRRCL